MTQAIATTFRKPLALSSRTGLCHSLKKRLPKGAPTLSTRLPGMPHMAGSGVMTLAALDSLRDATVRLRSSHECHGLRIGASRHLIFAQRSCRPMQPQGTRVAVMAGSVGSYPRRTRHDTNRALTTLIRSYMEEKDRSSPSSRDEFLAMVRPLIENVYNKLPLDFSQYSKVHETRDDYVLWRKGNFHVLSVSCRNLPASTLFNRPTLSIPLSPSDEKSALENEDYRKGLARRVRQNPDTFFSFSLEFHSEYDVLEGRLRTCSTPRQSA